MRLGRHQWRPISVGLLASAVLVGTALVASPGAQAITTPGLIIATPAQPNGWATHDAAPQYVYTPDIGGGLGSLKFSTPTASSMVDYYHSADSAPMAKLLNFGYAVDHMSGAQPVFVLQIHTDGVGGGLASNLVWDPALQPGPPLDNDGVFGNYDSLQDGMWWSSVPIPGDPTSSRSAPVAVPFSQIASANPIAVMDDYGISQGAKDAGAVNYVNDADFNWDNGVPFGGGEYTEFEAPTPTITTAAPYALQTHAGGLPTLETLPNVTATLTFVNEFISPGGGIGQTFPIQGQTVTFTAGPVTLCSATTSVYGVALCQPSGLTALFIVIYGGFTATFAGNPGENWAGSTGHGSLIQ